MSYYDRHPAVPVTYELAGDAARAVELLTKAMRKIPSDHSDWGALWYARNLTEEKLRTYREDISRGCNAWFDASAFRTKLGFADAVRKHGDGWISAFSEAQGEGYTGAFPKLDARTLVKLRSWTPNSFIDTRGAFDAGVMHMATHSGKPGDYDAAGRRAWQVRPKDIRGDDFDPRYPG